MTRWVSGASVRLAKLVVVLAIALVGFGAAQLRSAPVDTYPEFLPPMVQIRTEALGLSATEVEQLITVPLEQDLLNGVPWLSQIRSESMSGLSAVDLIFEPGTNILHARQMVQERLAQVVGLPNVGSRPTMVQPLSSTSRVLMIALSSKSLSLIDMSVLARWKIRPRLMGIPGVSNVAIWGQRDRQLQVQVDPRRLAARGVTLNQVIDSTGNAMWSSPLTFVEASTPGTGGFIDTTNQRFGVQHMMPITTPKQLAQVTIEDTAGRRLRLSDVASVVQAHQPLIGDARIERGPSLLLVVQKFPNADTLQVSRDVEKAMAALSPGLTGIRIDTVYRPAGFIESTIHNVGLAGLAALILVIVVLGLFTFSWRVVLTAFLAIPVSVVAAAYVLFLRGTTFNSFTVAGLAVALAVIVDDAVSDTHSIWRRLQERRAGVADGAGVNEQVLAGSHDARRPLLYATIILIVLVVPLAVMGGVAGAFSREFAVSYGLGVLASLAVALTVTPAAASLLMRTLPDRRHRAGPVTGVLHRLFDRVAPRFLDSRRWAYGSVAVLAVTGLAVLLLPWSASLLPGLRDGDVLVELRAAPGTSLPEMDRLTAAADRKLAALPGVRDVAVHVGRAVTSDQVVDVNSAELWLSVRSAAYTATVDAVHRILGRLPGLTERVTSYDAQQLSDAQTGNGYPLTVRVFGQDLPTLRAQAARVRNAIASVPGVVRPRVERVVEQPTIQVEVNLAAAERHGIRPGDVRRTAATLLSGLLVGNLYEEQKVFDVVVWGTPAVRRNLDTVKKLMIDTPSGGQVPLQDVATVKIGPAPSVIRHEDVSRYLDVSAGVSGRSISSVTQEVATRVQRLHYPYEYHSEVLDATAAPRAVDGRVVGLGLAALAFVYLLLQAMSGSWRTATLLFVLLPLALVGGMAAAPLAGGLLTVGSVMGLLAVLAVATRNAAVLVQRIERRATPGASARALVLDGTRDVLAPVLLTAVTLAAAMLPFAALGGRPGGEILHPLAVVVMGGLVTSTLLTLFVIPAFYLRFAVGSATGPRMVTLPGQRPAPAGEEASGSVREVGHGAH